MTSGQTQVRGSVKIFLIESHARLVWDCTPCTSKLLLNYLLQSGSSCMLISGTPIIIIADAMPR